MASIGLQCTKWRHSKLLFCLLFVLLWKKVSPPKTKGIHFGQEILFHTRDESGDYSFCSMYEHDHESLFSLTTSSPDKFDCIAQRGWTGNGDAMWLVKPCVACVKLELEFNSRVALRALRKETAHNTTKNRKTMTTKCVDNALMGKSQIK